MFPYLIPYLSPLPVDYDCTLDIPLSKIGDRLKDRTGAVTWTTRVFHSGQILDERVHELDFRTGELQNDAPPPYCWKSRGHDFDSNAGFVETVFEASNDRTQFITKDMVGFYALCSSPERKTFRADGAYKTSSPMTIGQIAKFGTFCEGYPSLNIDRERDYGETVVFVNPYKKPILVSLLTHDGRKIERRRVMPGSALNVPLLQLLKDDENSYTGRLQLIATNRIIVFHVRHSLSDPTYITDHEHLDPFRSDYTHVPAFQKLRLTAGRFLDRRFGINWHRI